MNDKNSKPALMSRCATCPYGVERLRSPTDDLRKDPELECRRYPPRAVAIQTQSGVGFMNVHPAVAADHYCFEHPELKPSLADEVIGVLDGFGIDVDAVKAATKGQGL